eukprot:COSAG02_NODE_71_length_42019_cov_36.443893_12_plen_32_part_00
MHKKRKQNEGVIMPKEPGSSYNDDLQESLCV